MRTFHQKKNLSFCPTVNIDRLWSMLPDGVYEKSKAAGGSGPAPVLDVTKLVSMRSYFKQIAVCSCYTLRSLSVPRLNLNLHCSLIY